MGTVAADYTNSDKVVTAKSLLYHSLVDRCFFAEVAKLVDALASGASGGNPVEVQVLSSAPFL